MQVRSSGDTSSAYLCQELSSSLIYGEQLQEAHTGLVQIRARDASLGEQLNLGGNIIKGESRGRTELWGCPLPLKHLAPHLWNELQKCSFNIYSVFRVQSILLVTQTFPQGPELQGCMLRDKARRSEKSVGQKSSLKCYRKDCVDGLWVETALVMVQEHPLLIC